MSYQKNVQRQNNDVRREIVSTARMFLDDKLPQGLMRLLAEKKINKTEYALVAFNEHPPCCEHTYEGTVVGPRGLFLSFEVVLSDDGNEVLRVETWRDVTTSTEVNPRKPGTGKTFGCLALEVLAEIRGMSNITRDSASVAGV